MINLRTCWPIIRRFYIKPVSATEPMGWSYESTKKWTKPPSRNRSKDIERLRKFCTILKVEEYGLTIGNFEELEKCLYVNKNLYVMSKGNKISITELDSIGSFVLYSQISQWIDKLTELLRKNTSVIPQHIKEKKGLHPLVRKFLRQKNLLNIARISTPDSKVSNKVRLIHDHHTFYAIIGYLNLNNGQEAMTRFLDENIIKPILRDVVKM
ncbi:uncharacterized protein Ecym_3258 [Eremothecium cymbalariae DBVPG|uniref:RNase III domain-containing protein n=1 Tax=Eremothecium cymbalariae (strain CBS 270.75 / DBVPG 7215 / KCTC 17166 / NRRL Y-17582) TaxID=931890 RepID=G8JRI2_ERECY|nr:Hypothetical protein Ecym_3258 [Eremothecium cymbalariae DBVPG\